MFHHHKRRLLSSAIERRLLESQTRRHGTLLVPKLTETGIESCVKHWFDFFLFGPFPPVDR
jgi:hypothetical protein